MNAHRDLWRVWFHSLSNRLLCVLDLFLLLLCPHAWPKNAQLFDNFLTYFHFTDMPLVWRNLPFCVSSTHKRNARPIPKQHFVSGAVELSGKNGWEHTRCEPRTSTTSDIFENNTRTENGIFCLALSSIARLGAVRTECLITDGLYLEIEHNIPTRGFTHGLLRVTESRIDFMFGTLFDSQAKHHIIVRVHIVFERAFFSMLSISDAPLFQFLCNYSAPCDPLVRLVRSQRVFDVALASKHLMLTMPFQYRLFLENLHVVNHRLVLPICDLLLQTMMW